jgi:hypothetical protein
LIHSFIPVEIRHATPPSLPWCLFFSFSHL